MRQLLDVSLDLDENLATWPGSKGLSFEKLELQSGGTRYLVTNLSCGAHVGTHVDAPAHVIEGGRAIHEIPLDVLMGPAHVVHIDTSSHLTAKDLESASIPEGVERLLIQTRNSRLWQERPDRFVEDFVALTGDAAHWVVQRGIRIVGVDYLSVEPFGTPEQTHEILLGNGTIVIEGLDLSKVVPGPWELICLPIRLVGADGAPARVVLRSLQQEE